jgi:hypothetical protein
MSVTTRVLVHNLWFHITASIILLGEELLSFHPFSLCMLFKRYCILVAILVSYVWHRIRLLTYSRILYMPLLAILVIIYLFPRLYTTLPISPL